MNEKTYSALELFLSVCFMALGIVVMSRSDLFEGFVQYVMIGFIAAKIFIIVGKAFTYQLNKPFMFVQVALNLAIIVLLFVFEQVNALSFVASTSCFVDLGVNIIQSFVFKKSSNEFLRTSFFGIENTIYIIFTIIFIFNKDSDLLATGVLFGAIILYKGIAICLGNNYIRFLIDKTDFGKAIRSVHGLDIFFGLLIIAIMSSCIFPYIEPEVFTNYEDALWYCFTLITTIGTGEFVAHTSLGRLLSVIIGCYGIIIVSVLTSSFVVYLGKTHKKAEKDKVKWETSLAKDEEPIVVVGEDETEKKAASVKPKQTKRKNDSSTKNSKKK